MRTLTTTKSLSWVGANPSAWVGAVNPLPVDMAIGVFALTLTNIVPGSAVQIEDLAATTTFYFGVVAGNTLLVNLSKYGEGSPLNSLVIKVRKGSAAPYYQPYRTETTAIVGSQAIYVSQIEDQ